MTREEERQLLKHTRGLYAYKVAAPVTLFWVGVGCVTLVVGTFLLIGVATALTRLFG